MTGRLAGTIFNGSGNDAMVAVDAYKVSTNETRNSLFSTTKGIFGQAIDGLYANKNSVRELANVIMLAKTGSISKADMLERSLGALGSSLPSLLGQLGGTLKNALSGAAGEFLGDGAQQRISALYDNAELLISAGSISDTQDMAEFLNELSGNSDLLKVVNIGAESAIYGGILKELISFGIPELVDDVVDQIESTEVKKNALAYMSTTAVNGSDLVIVNKVIDQIGLTAFLERNPDAINQLLISFFFGTKDTVETWPAKRMELFALLTRINVHWKEVMRNGTYVPYLAPFAVASKDAKSLFMMSDPERTLCLAATTYKPTPVVDVIKELYPNALVTS